MNKLISITFSIDKMAIKSVITANQSASLTLKRSSNLFISFNYFQFVVKWEQFN
jgi:hypothetical protein